MRRLLALALILIIGSPNCWCCLLKAEPVTVPHDCCMATSSGANDCPLDKGTTKKGQKDEDCSCDLSKTKREMSTAPLALPAPIFVIASPVETDLAFLFGAGVTAAPWLIDDGPPIERPSVLSRNCVLRL